MKIGLFDDLQNYFFFNKGQCNFCTKGLILKNIGSGDLSGMLTWTLVENIYWRLLKSIILLDSNFMIPDQILNLSLSGFRKCVKTIPTRADHLKSLKIMFCKIDPFVQKLHCHLLRKTLAS